ncbi:MAG TPA: cation diffusion facilitator family transporter [Planctomycetota bacterium]|nr:cation diffusion facilitator family transporter [Planctomycetota bacterium]
MADAVPDLESANAKGLRAVLLGVLVNAILVGVKLVSGVLGNSYALIADAMESALDILSSLIVYSGLRIGNIPADENHPYGHGKAEALAAMAVAISLIAAAIGLAIQSVREILVPHHAPAPFTLIVLVVVVIAKEIMARYAHGVATSIQSSSIQADSWHHRSDALTSAAAFIGISVALAMGKGYESADDWAALLACVIIAFNGMQILRAAIAEIMDKAQHPEIEQQVRAIATAVPGVVGIEQCRIRKYGLRLVVDVHVEVDGNLTVARGHEIAHQVKDALRESSLRIEDALVHIEPA